MEERSETSDATEMAEYMTKRAEATWNHFGKMWLSNTRMNIPQINETIHTQQLLDIGSSLPEDIAESDTAFIFAAGASLQRYEDQIKDIQEKGIILASPTVLSWLRHHGVEPHMLMVTDASESQAIPIEISGGARDMKLLCAPTASPKVVRLFDKENVFWFNSLSLGKTGNPEEVPQSSFLKDLLSPYDTESEKRTGIQSWVAQAGCVTNQAVILLDWCRKNAVLGMKRIVLLGADYGFWNGYARVPIYEEVPTERTGKAHFYENERRIPAGTYRKVKPMGDGLDWKGYKTNKRMVLYKRSLLIYYMSTASPLFSASDGILTEIPQVTFEQIMEGNYPEPPSQKQIIAACEPFMNDEFPNEFPFKAQTDKEETQDEIPEQ